MKEISRSRIYGWGCLFSLQTRNSDIVWSSAAGRLAWGRTSRSPPGVSEPEEREGLSKELLQR